MRYHNWPKVCRAFCSLKFTGTGRHVGHPLHKWQEHSEDAHPHLNAANGLLIPGIFFNSCSKELSPYLFHSLVTSHKSGIQLFLLSFLSSVFIPGNRLASQINPGRRRHTQKLEEVSLKGFWNPVVANESLNYWY